MPNPNRCYGWVPDKPDARDYRYSAPRAAKLPARVSLLAGMPAAYDQGDLGSCTANAIGAVVRYDQRRQKLRNVSPSRLFVYYNEREIEGTVESDAGATIRDSVKAVNDCGFCPEASWPYTVAKFDVKPPAKAYAAALPHKGVTYQRVPRTLGQMKGCLAAGTPFVIGFSVYESFESDAVAATGVAPMPQRGEDMLGGHAVPVIGYDDADDGGRFTLRNSWGKRWGDKGNFTLPYAYLLNPDLADDFWCVTIVK